MGIRLHHLYKAFGEKRVLQDLQAEFPAGRCTCIMGESGLGKTTLLRILMGLATADAGEITGTENLIVGAVFQEDRLCESFSAVANVAFACNKAVSKGEIIDHLTAVGLAQSARQPVRELSGGMRRRVAVVRAVLSGANLLLMDEPFKGLDQESKETAAAYLKAHTQGKTILMATHSLEEVALMDGCPFYLQEAMGGRIS